MKKEICHERNECTKQYCSKRHPRECRYFIQFGRCKFGGGCAYSHYNDGKSHKEEKLEKEVEDMKKELSEMIKREVSEIKEDMRMVKKDVSELKNNVSELKKLLAYMNRKINAIEPLNKEKNEKRGDKKD